jgi:hypothetical protein
MSSRVVLPGDGLWLPRLPVGFPVGEANTSVSLTSGSASNKIAAIGPVKAKQYFSGTKKIQSIEYRTAGNTVGTGTVRLSVQGLGSAAPTQPDGTIKGDLSTNNALITYAVPSANQWHAPGNLGDTVTVHWGDIISVVWEWSSAGSGSTFTVAGINQGSALPSFSTFNGTIWAAGTQPPDIVLNFDDGTFGTIGNGSIFNTFTTETSRTSASNPVASANCINLPFDFSINGLAVNVQLANVSTSTYTLAMRDATGAIVGSCSVSPSPAYNVATASSRWMEWEVPETDFSKNTDYFLELLATGAGGILGRTRDFNAAAHLDLYGAGGQNCCYATRALVGSTSYTKTTTKQLEAAIRISKYVDTISAGGAGSVFHPGMAGGMRG